MILQIFMIMILPPAISSLHQSILSYYIQGRTTAVSKTPKSPYFPPVSLSLRNGKRENGCPNNLYHKAIKIFHSEPLFPLSPPRPPYQPEGRCQSYIISRETFKPRQSLSVAIKHHVSSIIKPSPKMPVEFHHLRRKENGGR